MQSADQRVQSVHPGQPHGLPDDVDHARVAAAGEYHQTPIPDVHHERLVVEHHAWCAGGSVIGSTADRELPGAS